EDGIRDFHVTGVQTCALPIFTAPTGNSFAIDYERDMPTVAMRVQEVFGLKEHPMAAGVPLTLELLSPAHRPIQTTADLPGFWARSGERRVGEERGSRGGARGE